MKRLNGTQRNILLEGGWLLIYLRALLQVSLDALKLLSLSHIDRGLNWISPLRCSLQRGSNSFISGG